MNNRIIAVVLAIALGLGLYGSVRPAQVKNETIVKDAPVQLGSVTGPDVPYSYFRVNGVQHVYFHSDFAGTSTSTPCNPQITATSTLVYADLMINNASTTATTWTVAKASKPNATTTVITTFPALGSGAQGTMVASTTAFTTVAGDLVGKPDLDPVVVFGPGSYLAWGVTGLTFTGYDSSKLGGTCNAEFIVD